MCSAHNEREGGICVTERSERATEGRRVHSQEVVEALAEQLQRKPSSGTSHEGKYAACTLQLVAAAASSNASAPPPARSTKMAAGGCVTVGYRRCCGGGPPRQAREKEEGTLNSTSKKKVVYVSVT